MKLPIGKDSRGVCPRRTIRWRIHFLCIILAATISLVPPSSAKDSFDHLGLPSLNLSDRPELRYLSAQGNQFRRLDVSGNPKLTRLLLFGNPFDRPGIETLLSTLSAHGNRDGFLGISGLRKQTLRMGGRMSLATLRSRNWIIPQPGREKRFGLMARTYLWDPAKSVQGGVPLRWSFSSVALPAASSPLPQSGFADDEPRLFHVTSPEGFYSITSIDLSNKGLIKDLDLEIFPSLFQVKLSRNDLDRLNFSDNPWLTSADCEDNRLTDLDISSNPALEELRLSNNALAKLDLGGNPNISYLDVRYNRMKASAVDSILFSLVDHGKTGGTVLLDGGGNSGPTARGRGAAWVLSKRSWRVETNRELDYDDDGLPDAWELETFGSRHSNSAADTDGDGLSNLREHLQYLNPTNPDSDGDGYSDGAEVSALTNPLDPEDLPSPSGVVKGVVWEDANHNLAREPDETGIGGINVFLTHGKGSNRATTSTRTSADGDYRFSGTSKGLYSVSIDWGAWKPRGPMVREVVLPSGDAIAEIDFALSNPLVAYSQWAVRYFDNQAVSPNKDPDGDGYPNLLEYALGTHPLVATSRGLPQLGSSHVGDGFRFSLNYVVSKEAIDLRTASETYRDGAWREVKETSGRNRMAREASIMVADGEVGLLRLRASLASDPGTVVRGPPWGGHALVLEPGVSAVGLPLVNERILAGRIVRNDATSITLVKLDAPLKELLGRERAYLEVVEGQFEGERWEVAGVQPHADRLSLAVNHAANTRVGPLPNLAGRKVVVRPHVSLGQVFGRRGEVLAASASPKKADLLWFLESGRLAPYHLAASPDGEEVLGWSRWANLSRFWDRRPIFPGEGFFAQRVGEIGVALFMVGEVRTNRMAMPLREGANFVSLGFPATLSFDELGLTPLGGLAARPTSTNADQAFIWTGTGYESHFLFGDFGRGSDWRRLGPQNPSDPAKLLSISSGEGFFLDLIEPLHLYFTP
ncbi:MAG: SdrD B-like domain-containing protein [Opitutales bacterium]